MTELSGRVVGIWGLGKEGLSMARTAAAHGAARIVAVDDRADVRAPEIANLTVDVGPDAAGRLRDTDIVFVSPGVPWRHPVFAELRRSAGSGAGPAVSNAADWYMGRHGGHTVGITGTKGKSTTAAFLAHLLTGLGVPTVAAGNIGTPLSDLEPAHGEWVVAELSSQQCALLRTPPAVSVITNLYQDHLDFHGDVASYYEAKSHVFGSATAALVTVPDVIESLRAIGISQFPPVRTVDPTAVRVPAGDSVLSYPHNTVNAALAAAAAGQVLGRAVTDVEVDAAAASFAGLPHRLQTVRRTGPTRWIDDTLATTGEAVVAALRAMRPDEEIALIVGGMDRSLDYRQLDEFLCSGQRRVRLIQGPTNGALIGVRFAAAHPDRTHLVDDLAAAVRVAAAAAVDVVLLSPGAASYDIFRNYEEKAAMYCRYIDVVDTL
ncbi:UDP-N-acetylmuramoyl-L-alanine--D-glutamate ligase [Mycobacterium sp. AMU20-3851]|uniref:UDP-N-acetylmuramoyl-L-alanine--D-glutamate ligase n=1 Tax=Mycobacterium sp. AMU20-3851 TaxID=3122055 RepID=UPI0037540069